MATSIQTVRRDLKIRAGSPLSIRIGAKRGNGSVDISAYTFTGKIRTAFNDVVVATLTCQVVANKLVVSLTSGQTTSLNTTVDPTKRDVPLGVYDVKDQNGDRWLEGNVTLSRQASF